MHRLYTYCVVLYGYFITIDASNPFQYHSRIACCRLHAACRNCLLLQVVLARTSDPEQNFFSDEFDGEGLNIDEVRL
jgi:hypothetical protein